MSEHSKTRRELIEENTLLKEKIRNLETGSDSVKDHWQNTFDTLPDLVAFIDSNHRIMRVNLAMAARLKCSKEDAVGRFCYEIVHGLSSPPDFCPHAKTMSSGAIEKTEVFEDRLDGYFDVATTPLCDAEGNVTGIVHIAQDITERKQTEIELQEKTRMLESISENMFDLVSLTDMQGNYKFIGASHRILGYDLDWLIGRNVLEFVHPGDLPEVSSAFGEFLASQDDNRRVEYRYRCADGGYLWFETVGKFIKDESGKPKEILFSTRDFTGRKKNEEALREREAFIQAVMDNLPIGVAVNSVDPTVEFSYMNDNFPKIYRTTREALSTPDAFWDVVYEDPVFREQIRNRVMEDCSSGDPERMNWEDVPFTRTGEGLFFICARNIPLKGEKLMVSTVWDVTNRKRAEEALRESEEKHRRLFETMAPGVIYQDADGTIISANPAAERILGLSFEQMRGKTSMDPRWKMIREDGSPVSGAEHPAMVALRTGQIVDPVVRGVFHPEKNAHIWLSITAIPLFQPGETLPFQAYATFEDITERKKAEAALLESEKRFQRMLGVVPDMISIHSPAMDILYSNWQGFAAVPENKRIPNTKCYKTYRDLDAACPDCRAKTVLETRKPFHEEALLPDGTWVDLRVIPILDKDNKVEMFIEWVRDISDWKRTEKELFNQKVHFESLFTNTNDAIVFTDTEHRVMNINVQFARLFGYGLDEIKGRNINEVVDPHGMAANNYASQRFLSGENVEMEAVRYRKNGEAINVLIKGAPVIIEGRVAGGYAIYSDITQQKLFETERKALQGQLSQSQKMEAIGTLAGGIAHDFNNILSAVMGYSEMAQMELPRESDAGRYIEQVLQASNRAKDLVKQILAFSRQSDEDMRPLKTGLLLKEAVKLIRASIPSTIEIRTELSASKDTILANATQIHQVIMNLSTNAYHAMHDSGGVLDLSLREVELDGESDPENRHLSPGRYLLLGISDTGCGMSLDIVERIFDPYFTTKEKDVGTGLGLSIVHGIVKQHGGDVRVFSEVGKGTVFHVLLPALDEEVRGSVETHRDLPKGTGRILFVDDELPIADIGMLMLSRQGYDVEVKTSSLEALEIFRSRPGDFDLLITDMTMPHFRGDALARAVIEIRPELPVILCTGYSDMIDEEKARATGIRCVLKKPVGLSELAVTVYDILSGEDPARGEG